MMQLTHMLLMAAAGGSSEPTGQIVYEGPSGRSTTSSTYTFIVPAGVNSVSIVAVGAGSGPNNIGAGQGGSLAYYNNVPVTPGTNITIDIFGPAVNDTYGVYINLTQDGLTKNIRVSKGNHSYTSSAEYSFNLICESKNGNVGGLMQDWGNTYSGYSDNAGGGGAGGYSGPGGNGGFGTVSGYAAPAGGGGGGGAGPYVYSGFQNGGAGGGGVGLLGQGSSGAGGDISGAVGTRGGRGGSGGGNGADGSRTTGTGYDYYGNPYQYPIIIGGLGGRYGGAQGGCLGQPGYTSGAGGGAVRIIWPGTSRKFPNTLTGNM